MSIINLSSMFYARFNKLNQYIKKYTEIDDTEDLIGNELEELEDCNTDINNLMRIDENFGKIVVYNGIMYSLTQNSPFIVVIKNTDKFHDEFINVKYGIYSSYDFFEYKKNNSKNESIYNTETNQLKFFGTDSSFELEKCEEQKIKSLIKSSFDKLYISNNKNWKLICELDNEKSLELYNDFKVYKQLIVDFRADNTYNIYNYSDFSNSNCILNLHQKFLPKNEENDTINISVYEYNEVNICYIKLSNKQRELKMYFRFIGSFSN